MTPSFYLNLEELEKSKMVQVEFHPQNLLNILPLNMVNLLKPLLAVYKEDAKNFP